MEPQNQTFNSFLGYFNVPPAPIAWPASDGGIIYLFTGLQNYNWIPAPPYPQAPPGFDIIQPVLQYGGGSSNGGGKYWGVANWYVTVDSGAVWSDLLKLNTGNVIFGNMTKIGSDSWFIGSIVNGVGQNNLTISRSRLDVQPWAYVTLEVYNLEQCDWFPTAGSLVNFTSLELFDSNSKPIQPVWTTFSGQNPCKNTIQVVSPQQVNIDFNGHQ